MAANSSTRLLLLSLTATTVRLVGCLAVDVVAGCERAVPHEHARGCVLRRVIIHSVSLTPPVQKVLIADGMSLFSPSVETTTVGYLWYGNVLVGCRLCGKVC